MLKIYYSSSIKVVNCRQSFEQKYGTLCLQKYIKIEGYLLFCPKECNCIGGQTKDENFNKIPVHDNTAIDWQTILTKSYLIKRCRMAYGGIYMFTAFFVCL